MEGQGNQAVTNSRNKGATGERELANWLTERGYKARRGQQFSGSPESPDVVCPALGAFHIECKRTERLSLYKAMKQAEDDAGQDQIPVLFHRRNRERWLVVMDGEDWLGYIEAQFPIADE